MSYWLLEELGKSGFKIDGDELYIYLNQLVKDGFVKEWNDTNGIGRYSILFSGVATDISGGYSHLQKETNRLRNLEEYQKWLAKRMYLTNVWIAVGSILVAIATFGLLCWELYKYYCLHLK